MAGSGRPESAPARLIEELYKILRAGASERSFRMLAERGLLDPIAHQLQKGCGDALWRSLSALDAYRGRFEETPGTLTNAVLLGSLLVPLGPGASRTLAPPVQYGERRKEPAPSLGMLPLARRDVERLGQILGLQRRLLDMNLSPRARRALTHRGPFQEALTWLDIHGQAPDVLEHWRGFIEAAGTEGCSTTTLAYLINCVIAGRSRIALYGRFEYTLELTVIVPSAVISRV